MNEKKFDPKKLAKLNNPQRLIDIPPDYIWDKLNLKSPDIIADIGAGTGLFSIAFLNKSGPSKIYACDLSEVMIEWMKENVIPDYPNIIPVKTEEKHIPLTDEIADLVFMITLHHELEEPAMILKESFRILNPGGTIFIADWKKIEMPEGPPVSIRCIPEQVMEQMERAGFINLEIDNDLEKHFLVTGKKRKTS
jgi:ubiquinone/menaquinone biosynthesis C-methylase UbiE